MEQPLELQSLGILLQTKVPRELQWMTDNEKQVVLQVFMAGESGLNKSGIKTITKKHPDSIFNLEVRGLVEWLSDKAGRPVALACTWKGDEIAKVLLQIAKNESKKRKTEQEA